MEKENLICSICGKPYDIEEYNDCRIKELMVEKHCCFSCGFWLEKIEIHDENTLIISSIITDESGKEKEKRFRFHSNELIINPKCSAFSGFGAAKFYFEKTNGDLLFSNNLWMQGEIPEHFKNEPKLQVNCKQINKEDWIEKSIQKGKNKVLQYDFDEYYQEDIITYDMKLSLLHNNLNKTYFIDFSEKLHCLKTRKIEQLENNKCWIIRIK